MNSPKGHMAFTLIELLIVIAIIMILAAVLFPVFETAREKSRQSACSSNLKQIGVAMLQYAQDYDEQLPCGNNSYQAPPVTNRNNSNFSGWAAQIYTYVKTTQVYACQDDQGTTETFGLDTHGIPYVPLSYAYNKAIPGGSYVGLSGGTWIGVGPSLVKFTAPAVTVLICEIADAEADIAYPLETSDALANGSDGSGNFTGTSAPTAGGPFYATGRLACDTASSIGNTGSAYYKLAKSGVHSGGSNYLMCDGHVKWLIGTAVSGGNSNCVPWGPQNVTSTNYSGCAYSAVGANLSTTNSNPPTSYFAATFSPV